MSRANCFVVDLQRPQDGIIAYGLYNGTTDYFWPRLYKTSREAWEKYDGDLIKCTCGGKPKDVALIHDYGTGDVWKGEVCMTCMCIVSGQENPIEKIQKSFS
jgi:hypothetical protein